jgi:hypothetical protein
MEMIRGGTPGLNCGLLPVNPAYSTLYFLNVIPYHLPKEICRIDWGGRPRGGHMTECIPLRRDMLKDPIDIQISEEPLDFARARTLATQRARQEAAEPMLLAWYNRGTGEFSPQVTCCGDDRPTWLIYAESRGGDLIIDINNEAYVFIYRRSL